MVQPARWWWGLLPLLLLWWIANGMVMPSLRADIETRARLALNTALPPVPGIEPATLLIEGRDVGLSGQATSAQTAQNAVTSIESLFGVRRTLPLLMPAVAIAPYTWSARREGSVVTLSGHVPDEATRKANLDAAAKLLPGGKIEDRQIIGYGAPAGFAAMTGQAITYLGALSEGDVSLSQATLSLKGRGVGDSSACGAFQNSLKTLGSGLSAGPIAVECPPPPPPPAPAPPPAAPVASAPAPSAAVTALEWSARKTADGIVLAGMAPSAAAKAQARAAAALAASGPVQDEGVHVAAQLPATPDYAAATQFALSQLKSLSAGEARLQGNRLTVTGAAPSPAARSAVEAALKSALPAGLVADTAAVTVRPYVFQARSQNGAMILEGLAPDVAIRAALLGALDNGRFKGKVTDALTLVPGAPEGAGQAMLMAVQALARLDEGAARLEEGRLLLSGASCSAEVKTAVEQMIRAGLPAAITAGGVIEQKTGAACVSCAEELSKVKGSTILFQQAQAEVADDAGTVKVLDEVAAILKTCPAARIAVRAHTNRDGEDRGFDNIALSNARAEAVTKALVQRGVAGARLAPQGLGSSSPLVPHGSPGAREQNRRIEFIQQP